MAFKAAFLCIFIHVVVNTYAQVQEGTPCYTPKQQYGTCIGIKKCDVFLQLLRLSKTLDPEMKNYLKSSQCGVSGDKTPLVCCPQVPDEKKPVQVNQQETKSLGNDAKDTLLLLPPNCGYSNVTNPKVVGGIPAKLGEFPWIVALGYRNPNNPDLPKWLCGGTLITDTHILTAAHCVYNRRDLYIARIGDLDLYDDNDGAFPENILLAKAKIHENFSSVTFTDDIAILTLQRKAEVRGAWPICLPLSGERRTTDYVGYTPFVSGWGSLNFNGPSSSVLQLVSVPVVKNDACKRAYSTNPNNPAVIDHRVLCAGLATGGKDACRGDSGGPLMYGKLNSDGVSLTFFQIGVVSYGYKCAEPGYPGVYTRVTNYIDWIKNNLD